MEEKIGVQILDSVQLSQKINRLAYQILEQNFDEQSVVIAGISERGFRLAERVFAKLQEIAHFDLELVEVRLDKTRLPGSEVNLDPFPADLRRKSVILCDDVLYSGKTLAYAVIPFLEAGVKKLHCLVMIQRHHLEFPIQPTYVGMALATTLQEHITVDWAQETVFIS